MQYIYKDKTLMQCSWKKIYTCFNTIFSLWVKKGREKRKVVYNSYFYIEVNSRCHLVFWIWICKSLEIRRFNYLRRSSHLSFFVPFVSCCFCLKRPSLIYLFNFTKRCVSILIFLFCLLVSLSISLLIFFLWIIGNPCIISQNCLSLFISFSLSLSKSSPLIALNKNRHKLKVHIIYYISYITYIFYICLDKRG